MDFKEWMQDITIYHKEANKYEKYNVEASVRHTSIQNRNNTGVTSTDKVLIRIFDISGYNKTYKVEKGDIVVNKMIEDAIIEAPITELRKKYGKDNVYEVESIDYFIFDDNDLDNHIKIGAI